MNNEKSKKVTYEIDTQDTLKLSRKVEHSNRPRINIDLNGDDLVTVLAFGAVYLMFFLFFR